MAKFYDAIGFGESVEKAPGVWADNIVEYKYRGDVIRNSRAVRENQERVNDDISVGNSISIVADEYVSEHIFAIRYIKWAGSYWKVANVDVQRPRLILRLGGAYNGPKAVPPVSP